MYRSKSAVEVTPLAGMLKDAYEHGYSSVFKDHMLLQNSSDLVSAYAQFMAQNPDFVDEFGDIEPSDTLKRDFDFELDVVKPALDTLPSLISVGSASILDVYDRYYKEGDEGTGLHDDKDTNADLVVVRTVFGTAEFTCQGIDGPEFADIVTAEDVIAFRADMLHSAGTPIGGPRQIAAWAISLS